ncbi:MAG: oligosaccharide flippase family protein [Clostridiales bacterium]|jgi:putative peptidoglycan lipid II flippase|nr:oligosaccharide flippase family protein [Clostridiales bacterium]
MKTSKAVGMVMLLSTLARCLALAGSMAYTAYFGYTLETDVYSYAVNLPNLIFTCLGTSLVTVVIPIFTGRLASGDSKAAYRFIDSVITISLLLSAAIAAAGMLAAPAIVSAAPRFEAEGRGLALFALRLMFPVMLFYALSYIFQGVLQSNGRFAMPAVAGAFSGLSVIAYVLALAGRFGIRGLLVATFAGLAMQAIALVPSMRRLGYRFRPRADLSDPDVRLSGRLALPVLVSSSSYQLNMFINSTLATGFAGGVVTIANTQNLAFTAAQLFILSALAVYFPKMSALHAKGDRQGFIGALASVMRLIVYFAVPASAALAYLSKYLIPILYGRGRVTPGDIEMSVAVFSCYAASIASIGFKEAADRAFYAMKDSRAPAAASVLIMALNVSLSLVLKRRLGLVGLPLAYAASITAGAAILLCLLYRRRLGGGRAWGVGGADVGSASVESASVGGARAETAGAGGAGAGSANVGGAGVEAAGIGGASVGPASAQTVGRGREEGAAATTVGAKAADGDAAGIEAAARAGRRAAGRGRGEKRARGRAADGGLKYMLAKCIIACVAMLAAMLLADAALPEAAGLAAAAAKLAALAACGGAAYFAATLALRVGEASEIAALALRLGGRLRGRIAGRGVPPPR